VADACEHDNEYTGSIEDGKLQYLVSDVWLLTGSCFVC
jgi:hypothetical protein